MREFILALALAALAGCNADGAAPVTERAPIAVDAPSGDYVLDKTHASLVARVNHFGLSNYTLRFNGLDASLTFDAEKPERSSVVAEASIGTIDTDYPGPRDFDGELQSADWLDAATHPLATFRSTSIAMTGSDAGRMTGDLTLHGVTRPVSFDIRYNHSYARHPFGRPFALIGFSARGVIRRSEFGITQFLPEEGSMAGVGDEVEILIEAEFLRPLAE